MAVTRKIGVTNRQSSLLKQRTRIKEETNTKHLFNIKLNCQKGFSKRNERNSSFIRSQYNLMGIIGIIVFTYRPYHRNFRRLLSVKVIPTAMGEELSYLISTANSMDWRFRVCSLRSVEEAV
jgi:hypothetical protein